MVVFNYSTRELTTKIVYYGPGLCGKTTNLQFIYDHMPQGVRGKMLSLATKSDRTLFFDFLPIDLGQIQGMKTKVQLYTVPGQVFYNETRRLVLKGADGVVFVADSQENMLEANLDSFHNLEENLSAHGLQLAETPHVLQYNKQDLPGALPVDVLNEKLNRYNAPFYEAIATTGVGVQETLRHITKLVLLRLTDRYGAEQRMSPRPPAAAAPAAPSPSISAPVPRPALDAPSLAAEPAPAFPAAAAPAPASRPVAAPSPFSLDDDLALPSAPAPAPAAASSSWDVSLEDLLPRSEPAAAAPPAPAPARPAAPAVAPLPTIATSVAPPPRPAAPAVAPAARAAEDDDILGVAYSAPAVAPGGRTQKIDVHDLDSVFGGPPAAASSARPAVTAGAPVAVEVGPEDALFQDDAVVPTRLAPGEPQDLLVPLELELPDGSTRLFRLTVRLELAP